ncbi:FxsA family protein [bacterium]|nr:FxsA family protein [bacterium]
MKFVGLFFITVLALSYAELVLLVRVASEFGFLTTLMLCFFTAVVGGNLVRTEGLSVVSDLQSKMSKGQDPSSTILGGVLLFMSGVLLLVPGFITDVFGFLCLLRPFREKVGKAIFNQVKGSFKVNVGGNFGGNFGGGFSGGGFSTYSHTSQSYDKVNELNGSQSSKTSPKGRAPEKSSHSNKGDVIDVDYEEVSTKEKR